MRLLSDYRGFTLIEAIVAIVIVATTGMALFAWINSSLETMARVKAHGHQEQAQLTALEFVKGINPMKNPNGQMVAGSYKIFWEAESIGPARQGAGYPGGKSPFRLKLYKTRVRVLMKNREKEYERIASFYLRQVGFSK